MVSVIVAFSILMLGLVMFTSVIYTAGRMIRRDEDRRQVQEQAVTAYYTAADPETETVLPALILETDKEAITVSGTGQAVTGAASHIYYFTD